MNELILEMAESVKSNLKKNGFPAKSVAFPLDRLYESAHSKGINFNKVREWLEKEGIKSKIEASRMVFISSDNSATESMDYKEMLKRPEYAQMLKDPQFLSKAMDMFAQLGNDELAKMASMVPGVDMSQLNSIREKLKNISPEEKNKLGDLAAKWTADQS